LYFRLKFWYVSEDGRLVSKKDQAAVTINGAVFSVLVNAMSSKEAVQKFSSEYWIFITFYLFQMKFQ